MSQLIDVDTAAADEDENIYMYEGMDYKEARQAKGADRTALLKLAREAEEAAVVEKAKAESLQRAPRATPQLSQDEKDQREAEYAPACGGVAVL